MPPEGLNINTYYMGSSVVATQTRLPLQIYSTMQTETEDVVMHKTLSASESENVLENFCSLRRENVT